MLTNTIRFKINGLPKDKDYNRLPFGRQIEHRHAIAAFKADAKTVHISMKRRTFAKALKEAISIYDAEQFYVITNDSPNYRDDSFEFFYVSSVE